MPTVREGDFGGGVAVAATLRVSAGTLRER